MPQTKKIIVARISDICLISAAILIGTYFQTGNLEVVFASAKDMVLANAAVPLQLQIATVLLVVTAALKSAHSHPRLGYLKLWKPQRQFLPYFTQVS